MKKTNPQQFELFPALQVEDYQGSIRTMPEFDKALQNFIILSDFGAFVQYNFSGLEKSFSLNLKELGIDPQILTDFPDRTSPIFYLFPNQTRNQINRIKYEVRSFFNIKNCIQTSSGPFLFRRQFHRWFLHRKKTLANLRQYLEIEIGERQYRNYLVKLWESGMNWIFALLKIQNPYILTTPTYEEICEYRRDFEKNPRTLPSLDPSNPEYLMHYMILKTQHIPLTIEEFTNNIAIHSTFNTLHLDYLKNAKLDSIDDVRAFLKKTLEDKS